MRKWMHALCIALCVLSFVGCQVHTNKTVLLPEGTVSSVRVFSTPEYYDCFFYGTHTKPIIDYLESLSLQSDFPEHPDEYNGMTIQILITYENGTELELYHFGNTFIRSENSEWYKMDYKEAALLEELLKEKQA